MDKTLKEYREMRETFRSLPMDADTKRDNIRAINQIENALVSNIQMLKNNMIK